jgi:predicted DNA binding protein
MSTIDKRQEKQKELLLEQLRKTPIIEIAVKNIGIGRATYYRWRTEDLTFSKAASKALLEGQSLINDMAESQLISAIRDKNMTSIIFWLKNHHVDYRTRVEVTAKTSIDDEELTPEQKNLIDKALKMAALIPEKEVEEK